MKKIQINEPCHENWNNFTPTEQGAFCGKCQTNVIDFSTKSNIEIKTILLENSGQKMCGRFSKSQLNDFNSEYHLWNNQTQQTFQSKFMFALLLSFGLTLFSCTDQSNANTLNQITTMVTDSLTQTNIITDSIKTDSTINNINTSCDGTDLIMGDIDLPENEIMIMGELPIKDTVEIERSEKTHIKGKVAIQTDTIPNDDQLEMAPPMILGMISTHTEQEDINVIEEKPRKNDTLKMPK